MLDHSIALLIQMAVQNPKKDNRSVAITSNSVMECLQQFVLHFRPEIMDHHKVRLACFVVSADRGSCVTDD